ncbi:MAG TPA: hypothetical protein VHU61_03655 [Solirubrobacteraceae bacterium]|jgi:hypothetical protein|nr:hypothetical protein [Solirubrobacteraceae bacterium]
MLRRVALLLAPAAVLLAGCGASDSRPRPAICILKAQNAIAHDLSVSSDAIRFARSVGSNGMPQCAFSVRTAGHRAVVTVNVDNGPSAYFRLLRTVDEATQLFGPPPPGFRPPQTVAGLGPFASWFPNNHQLMATNDVDLLTVTVAWPGATRNAEVGVAHAAIVPYLARKHGHGNANDYP